MKSKNRAELNEGSCSWWGGGAKTNNRGTRVKKKPLRKIRMVLLLRRGLGDHLDVLHVVQYFYPHENHFSLLHTGI